MRLYIENPKDSAKKLLELINEFGKLTGYKINTQKSVAFSYSNNGLSEREIKKTIPFTIPSKRVKYLGINLTKDVKDLYSENYDTLKKKLKKIQISGSTYWIERILLKCPYYSEQSIDSTQFLCRYVSQN